MGFFGAPSLAQVSIFGGVLHIAFSRVCSDHLCRRTAHFEAAFFEPHHFFAQLLYCTKSMAHDNDRASFAAKLLDFFAALTLEGLIANSEHFVDQQNLWLNMCGDRETEPNNHAR